jgi:AcrR family transcriptional regulator
MPDAMQTLSDKRNRLLCAAGEVFAEQGFRNATIRDICERAGANVAAVNYYFSSKEQLYAAVLRFAHGCALEKFPPTHDLPPDASARQRLHQFVLAFLLRIFDEGQPAWLGKLMAREMVEPTAALDELVESSIRAPTPLQASLVAAILGCRDNPALLRRCVCSIVGQCLFYHHSRPVIQRLFPEQEYARSDIEALADHITEFSFAAIQHLADTYRTDRSPNAGGQS